MAKHPLWKQENLWPPLLPECNNLFFQLRLRFPLFVLLLQVLFGVLKIVLRQDRKYRGLPIHQRMPWSHFRSYFSDHWGILPCHNILPIKAEKFVPYEDIYNRFLRVMYLSLPKFHIPSKKWELLKQISPK